MAKLSFTWKENHGSDFSVKERMIKEIFSFGVFIRRRFVILLNATARRWYMVGYAISLSASSRTYSRPRSMVCA